MADMISILIFIIFAYFVVKKFVLPRIAAKKAAKDNVPAVAGVAGISGMESLPAVQTISQTAVQTGTHSVTCFDMRLVDATICDYDENGDNDGLDTFTQRMKYAASELLLNASTRGDNVRLYALNWKCYILLYVTYTVR